MTPQQYIKYNLQNCQASTCIFQSHLLSLVLTPETRSLASGEKIHHAAEKLIMVSGQCGRPNSMAGNVTGEVDFTAT